MFTEQRKKVRLLYSTGRISHQEYVISLDKILVEERLWLRKKQDQQKSRRTARLASKGKPYAPPKRKVANIRSRSYRIAK